ncbi:MAG: 4Fe-4S binding protein [Candidatus Methanomethylophilaceae archaeon]|nr:4Fe-4S binding protein [Candidatus Methanomethylophilaceae archaeon]
MGNLRIDADKCVGCGKCVRMCVMDNIRLEDGKAVECGDRCVKCGHCVSSCPKGAIELVGGGTDSGIRGSGFMDGRLISEEDLQLMYSFMKRGTFGGSQLWLRTLQGEELERYLADAKAILKENAAELPLAGELEERGFGPSLLEGKQVLFIFSDSPDHAFEASNRMKAAGIGLGIAGFHSNALMMAHKLSPETLDAYFPDSKGKMYMAYVIGHGRRMVEPLFKPLQGLKGIFRRSVQSDAGLPVDAGLGAGDARYVHRIPGNLDVLGERDIFGAEIHCDLMHPQRDFERDGFPRMAESRLAVQCDDDLFGDALVEIGYVDLYFGQGIRIRDIIKIGLHQLQSPLHREQSASDPGRAGDQFDIVIEPDGLEAGGETLGFQKDIVLSVRKIEPERFV